MKGSGYWGIGILNIKNSINYGTLYRTAQVLDADFIFIIGKRFKKQASDTMKSWRHIPLFEYKNFDDFKEHIPYDCELVGIELLDSSIPISEFQHPKRAVYLLGAEDNGLTNDAIASCVHIVKLPGERSMNVSVAGSIVMFDRVQKRRNKNAK